MSGFCFVTFSEHTCSVTGVIFTPNSQVVLSCSLDGTVRAFDLKRYKTPSLVLTDLDAGLPPLWLSYID